MTPEISTLLSATLVFVAGHFLLASRGLREPLTARLGEGGHRGVYSLIALASFVWMVLSYGNAPYIELWNLGAAARWLPVLLMPVAFVLVVTGLTTPSPTAVGQTARARDPHPTVGIVTVTRHPFLNGVALWALVHLAVNGDLASIILMGGMLVLAVGGMMHIDARRAGALGADWGPVAMTTSRLPFAAALAGRTKVDWRGIGLWRPVAGLVLYAALLHLHAWLFGVPALLLG